MRLGVVAIVVEDRAFAPNVQAVLSEFAEIIVARTGVPDRESGKSVISLIVKGTVEKISALCGKLGKIPSVFTKSALTEARA